MIECARILETTKIDGSGREESRRKLSTLHSQFFEKGSMVSVTAQGNRFDSFISSRRCADWMVRALQAFTFHFVPNENTHLFGLYGSIPTSWEASIAVLPNQQFDMQVDRAGPAWPFVLSGQKLLAMQNGGLGQLIRIVVLDQPNCPINENIRRALYWFTEGVRSKANPTKLICFMFAVEILLGEGGDNLSHKLAERIVVLSVPQRDERVELFRLFKKLYGKRSQVVHAGDDSVSERDLNRVRQFAFSAIIKATLRTADGTITSKEKLIQMLLVKQFSF